MGAWATGTTTGSAMARIAMVKNTGPDLDKIVDTLVHFGPAYDYIVTAYPPFLKHLLDRLDAIGFPWESYRLRGMVGGEDKIFVFDDARIADENLVVHRGDKKLIGEQLPILRGMLNASFAQLGYYTEISAEQLARQTDGLAHLLDESLLLYLTKAGRPIAFVLCLPDISGFVASVRGNLNLPNQLRLLLTRKRYRHEAVLVIKGTVPDEQGHATCGCSPGSCCATFAATAIRRCAARTWSTATPAPRHSTPRWAGGHCTGTPPTRSVRSSTPPTPGTAWPGPSGWMTQTGCSTWRESAAPRRPPLALPGARSLPLSREPLPKRTLRSQAWWVGSLSAVTQNGDQLGRV